MKNKEVINILYRMGDLLEVKGENIFKIKAYHKAAENLSTLTEDIEKIRAEDRLSEIPGVGKAIEEKIKEYLDTGKISAYEKLAEEFPESLLDLVNIPSVGPKKAKLFYEKFNIKSIDELANAAAEGKFEGAAGIRKKTIDNILRRIKLVSEGQSRMHIGTATRVAEEFIQALKRLPEIKQISVAGSLRRMKETIRDIDLLIDSSDPQKVMEIFVNLPFVKTINAHGETKSSVMTHDNIQVDARIVDSKSFGAALLYFTGNKNFNIHLRQAAIKKGYKISEYGVFDLNGKKEKCLASLTEEACLKELGLPFIPPELREEFGENDIFSGKPIPRLIEQKDIKGDLHVHSTWSDGQHTIEEMAKAAIERGYEYLAICDHSEKLKIAGGLTPADLIKKKKEIDLLNKNFKGFRILFGTEVEIDLDGNIDYNDSILSEFDLVIASVHSGFDQPSEKITSRLIKVCQNKHVDGIGHPTGRHIGKREPCEIDIEKLCKAARDTNTFLEINAFPQRLDLDSGHVYFARQMGVKIAINTDAHSTKHLEYMKFGIGIARRGWLEKKDVINTLSLKEFLKNIKGRNS